MIGYYVHHQGRGHATRAAAIAARLGREVTGLSSSPAPAGWTGEWIVLPRDDDPAADPGVEGEASGAPDAAGLLHWAPLRHDGMRMRSAMVSEWIARAKPAAMVVDVSVEVALLARLHGVPVVSVVLPGERADAPHRLGFGVSSALIAAWPSAATGMVEGLDPADAARLEPVGAITGRAPVDLRADDGAGGRSGAGGTDRRVLVLAGAGGGGVAADVVEQARSETPGWQWDVVGGRAGRWVDDPWPLLLEADVVVAHAGQNAVAEVAAARRPAVIVPESRPHDEQRRTAAVLGREEWPAVVRASFPRSGWPELLAEASVQDGALWEGWNDGRGAERAAAVIRRVAEGGAS